MSARDVDVLDALRSVREPELRRAADELGNRYPAADLLEIYLAAL